MIVEIEKVEDVIIVSPQLADREYFALLAVFAPFPATFDVAAVVAVWDVPHNSAHAILSRLAGQGLISLCGDGRYAISVEMHKYALSLCEEE